LSIEDGHSGIPQQRGFMGHGVPFLPARSKSNVSDWFYTARTSHAFFIKVLSGFSQAA